MRCFRNPLVCTQLALVSLLLAGCTQPTPYQPATDGFGYAEQRIERDRYRVSFAGNWVTARDTVQNYLLYRAAELTRETGHDHFTIVDRDLERSTFYHGTGFTHFGGGRSRGDSVGGLGTTTYTARPIDSYAAFADIVVAGGPKPEGNVSAYDAQDVISQLASTLVRPEP